MAYSANLILSNLNSNKHKSEWDSYTLNPTNLLNDEPVGTILETDSIKFVLQTENDDWTKIVLCIGDAQLKPFSAKCENGLYQTTWMPKQDRIFGYKAFFLHYCGLANISVHFTRPDGFSETTLFQSLNVCGRKITADRIERMLIYISTEIDGNTVKALSPTSFMAKLEKKGVAIADYLQQLESVVTSINLSIRHIITKPIVALRPSRTIMRSPRSCDLDSSSIEWITENTGLSEDAPCKEDGLFEYGFGWRGMPDVVSIIPKPSTDIYENRLIRYYLIRLNSEARRLYKKLRLETAAHTPTTEIISEGHVYVNFSSIAKNVLKNIGSSYSSRTLSLVKATEMMLNTFNTKIPTSDTKLLNIHITEKIKANRHYLLAVKHIHDWLENREILWTEKNIFSSIFSTPKLFEYYSLLLVNSWLKTNGESSSTGLFSGSISKSYVSLHYEPVYLSPKKSPSSMGIYAADRFTKGWRTPDIVIDVTKMDTQSPQRSLFILDAKCKKEEYVLPDLEKCILKYTHGLRDDSGDSPVTSLIMLYPEPRKSISTDLFIDYYKPPYGLFGSMKAYPVMGCQKIMINADGKEEGLDALLHELLSII